MARGHEDRAGETWAEATAWRVTYAGPQATWRSSSFFSGLHFVASIEDDALSLDIEPDVDLRPASVTIQLHGLRTPDALAFALATQQRAAAYGLEADITRIQTVSLSIAHAQENDVQAFWTSTLGYEPVGGRAAIDPQRRGPYLAFQHIDRPGRGRLHVDVSVPADLAQTRVEAALAAGGRLAVDREVPKWWGLTSPDNHSVDIVAWPDLQAET